VPCTLCGYSCASERGTGAEISKRVASLLDADRADDQESLATDRALARPKLNELHPEAIDLLRPEFSVGRNGGQRFTVSGMSWHTRHRMLAKLRAMCVC
jgi:hypothetical protein